MIHITTLEKDSQIRTCGLEKRWSGKKRKENFPDPSERGDTELRELISGTK